MASNKVPESSYRSSLFPKETPKELPTQAKYISSIMSNIENSKSFKLTYILIEKFFSSFNEKKFFKLLTKLLQITKTSSKYKQLTVNNKNIYLTFFINSILFLFEIDDLKLKNRKKLFFDFYLSLLKKFYFLNKISDTELLLIIKFIVYSSIYERLNNQLTIEDLISLKNKPINIYSRFKFSIEIIININNFNITEEYLKFLEENILSNYQNFCGIFEKCDILHLIYLDDKNDKIMNFLSSNYSFKYNKDFIGIFISKINEIYNKNDGNTLKVLQMLNKDINLLKKMKAIEDKRYKLDPDKIPRGFIFRNNKNGFYVNEVILKEEFSLIFSFNFSPERNNNNNDNEKIYFIINGKCLEKVNDGFTFYIKNNHLYHKKLKSQDIIDYGVIKENQTYICILSIKDYSSYNFSMKNENLDPSVKSVKNEFKNLISCKLNILVGYKDNFITKKCQKIPSCPFEGDIGPIIGFKFFFEEDIQKYIFGLRGFYENIVNLHHYETKFLNKYELTMNSFPNDINKVKTLFYKECLEKINVFPGIENKIFLLLNPRFRDSLLSKQDPIKNNITKDVIYFSFELNSNCFLENKYTPFEFLKYEGINFLILIFELIISNVDSIKTEDDRVIILNIFSGTVMFTVDLIYLMNISLYESDIRHILFAIEKCLVKICKKIKICGEISLALNKSLVSLTKANQNVSSNQMEYYIKIRNEILIFLLNIKLYDLNDYSVLEYFFKALNDCFSINPTGLMSFDILKKLLKFSGVMNQITAPGENKIKNNRQFKKFKLEYTNVLNIFFKISKKIKFTIPYTHLYKLISEEKEYTYKKFQYLKLFYLVSEYYFDNIQKKTYVNTWKYFVDLYNFLQISDNIGDISEKESEIIMAICIRIMVEYPIVSDIFKPNKYIKESLNITYRKQKRKTTININAENESNNKNNNINNNRIDMRRSTIFRKKEDTTKQKGEILRLENIRNNKAFMKTRSKSYSDCFKYKIIKYGLIVTNNEMLKKKGILSVTKKSIRKISNEINDINSISYWDKYIHYVSYNTLIYVLLEKSKKFNDYTFRALLLLILETNNEIKISSEVKLKFITKVDCYDKLKDQDFSSFLKLNYYNKEIKIQLLKLIEFVEKYKNNLTHITFDILFYLIMSISKNRENNCCVFKHFINSRKICNKIFSLSFSNKESCDLVTNKFSELCALVLPYHNKPFFLDFLYDATTSNNKGLHEFGQVLTKYLMVSNFENIKYHKFINSVILLYRIIKSKKSCNRSLTVNEAALEFLFNEDLILTKFNILKNYPEFKKKKCYSEVLYETILNLCAQTKNENYYNIICKLFLLNLSIFKKGTEDSKSIFYYVDELKNCGDKNNKVFKEFTKYESLDVPCISLQLLLKTLRVIYKYKDELIKNWFSPFITSFYTDSFLMFQLHSSKKKKYKNKESYNFLNAFIKKNISDKQYSTLPSEDIIQPFNNYYKEYLQSKNSKTFLNAPKKFGFTFNLFNFNFFNTNPTESQTISSEERDRAISMAVPSNSNIPLNDFSDNSFSSCKNKNDKNICTNGQKKIITQVNKRPSNILKELLNKEKGFDPFDLDSDDENIMDNNKNILKFKNEKNPFYLDKIESFQKVILFPKISLLEQVFGIYFTDRLFYNIPFIKMMSYYKYYIQTTLNKEISINNFFKYPIIMKNYISANLYFGGLFLKHDFNFFISRYFNISHPYFIDKRQQSIRKRIFPKVSDQDDITKFLLDKNDKNNKIFYVDLVSNRNVVFGRLIITEDLIFFENKDKSKFLEGKTEKEIENWLLGSQECDYSSRNKKIYMFKKEISEIINRRFLYLFQACELYLKNGKSYFFNFYSEENKDRFFDLLCANKKYKFKVISDLKTEFKKSDFTNKWLNNNISTLEYLLFINKYSCRSYNDVNQYPVFPWLIIYGNKERDLKYTTAAQTEDERMVLREKFPFSSQNFLYHYTTHYSNASFLIYYLIRINPFTDNQITLQVNKFDSPGRQFNSIDEIKKILFTTKQPREVIPEFFMSTEFFYNYNCNFFGVKNDNEKTLINDLINKENFSSPVEYVLNNEFLLESEKFKSKINFFFDNIFGKKQIGECEDYNRYDKYSYGDKINLKKKIKTFQERGLSLIEIRNKINSKSNKIISFGQTPYRLFDEIHPVWKPEKINPDEIANINEHIITFSKEFVNLDFSKGISDKKSTLYILVKLESNHYELYFYDTKMNIKKDKKINISKDIELPPKYLLLKDTTKVNIPKYNPKLIMIEYNINYFIFSRLTDYSFCIVNKNGESKSFLMDCLITCIAHSRLNRFFIGGINGKIIEFSFIDSSGNNNDLSLIDVQYKRDFIAHKKGVTGIYYSYLLELIISTGEDQKIFIRKYYDLSLLTLINVDEFKICVDIKINHNYLYMVFFEDNKNYHVVEVYSVNGLVLSKSKNENQLINNIDFDNDGNLLIGDVIENKIEVYDPSLNRKITEISLNNLILRNKKKKNQKEITIEKNNLFLNFRYLRENSCIYCHYSDGTILQRYLDINENSNKSE